MTERIPLELRDELVYECDCGAEIMVPAGDGVRCPKLGYHWREQCPDPPKGYPGWSG